jgi:hypothetical protein
MNTTAGTRAGSGNVDLVAVLDQVDVAAGARPLASCSVVPLRHAGAAPTMTELDGRQVYTRADQMNRYGHGLSTLETWYRDRATTGHPEPVGKIGRALAWDAEEWETWRKGFLDTTGLADFDELAQLVGRSRSTLARLWEQRDTNGHPNFRKRVEGTFYWDPAEYKTWFEDDYLTGADRAARVDFSGNAGDELTLAEFGRVLGLAPNTVTVYAKRPPAGWPQPVIDERLHSGRHRRRYTRQQAWDYAEQNLGQRHPGGGRPAGATAGTRRYPYDGDPRLQIARTALAETPTEDHSELPTQLASQHGSTPGTWAGILTTARQHPTD